MQYPFLSNNFEVGLLLMIILCSASMSDDAFSQNNAWSEISRDVLVEFKPTEMFVYIVRPSLFGTA